MKRFFLACVLIFSFLFGFSQTGLMIVEVHGINSQEGRLMIGLFNSEDDFRSKSNPVFTETINPSDSVVRCYFKDLPSGSFALAVFHDANNDETLNTKKLGIPVEGVGFSGTSQKSLRPPKYEEALFKFFNDTTIAVHLTYPKKSSQ